MGVNNCEGDVTDMPEALIIGRDEDSGVQRVKAGFEQAGWDTAVASGLMAAQAYLGAKTPEAVVVKHCGKVGSVGESEVPDIIRALRESGYEGPVAALACNGECAATFEQAGADRVLRPGISLADEVESMAMAMIA